MNALFYTRALTVICMLVAIADSGFKFSVMLVMRLIIIPLCFWFLYRILVAKNWYAGLGVVVNENTGKNPDYAQLKYLEIPLYLLGIIIATAGGFLIGLENTY